MDIKILLGKRIKEIRCEHQMTQFQLAEQAGIDAKHLSRIELGKNMPNPQTIERIAEIFEIEIKDLFDFYHLQDFDNSKKYIKEKIEQLNEEQLKATCKFIRCFVQ